MCLAEHKPHRNQNQGFGRDDEQLQQWIVNEALNSIWYSQPLMLPACEAFKCHQVLLQHARQNRAGCKFESPESKKARLEEKKTLGMSI